MSLVDHHGEVEYPFSQKTVFKAIIEAAPNIDGLTLDSADEISGRITFKAGVSLASWGENIPVQLIKVSSVRTQMKIMSTPKTGVMFGGAMDFGKNQQNINKIINAVSNVLSKYSPETEQVGYNDITEQLTKLKTLMDNGVLTEDEYLEQKKKVLNNSSTTSSNPLYNNTPNNNEPNPAPIKIGTESNENSSTTYAIIAFIVTVIIFLIYLFSFE